MSDSLDPSLKGLGGVSVLLLLISFFFLPFFWDHVFFFFALLSFRTIDLGLLLYYVRWSDGMRCCRSDRPGLCLFCYYQLSCVVNQQSRFWAFLVS